MQKIADVKHATQCNSMPFALAFLITYAYNSL